VVTSQKNSCLGYRLCPGPETRVLATKRSVLSADLEAVADLLPLPLLVLDENRRVLLCNPPLAVLLEIDPAQVAGERDREAFSPPLADQLARWDEVCRHDSLITEETLPLPGGREMRCRIHRRMRPAAGLAREARCFVLLEPLQEETDLLRRRVDQLDRDRADQEAALRVLLELRQRDQVVLESRLQDQLGATVEPYLRKLGQSPMDAVQKLLLDTALDNLQQLVQGRCGLGGGLYLRLTPTEARVAELVKEGLSSQEIAERLHVSVTTVASHRRSIRKRLGLKGRRVNLRQYLLNEDR